MPFTFDVKSSSNKIIHMKFHGVCDKKDHDAFKNIFEECLKGKPFGVIFDLSDVESAPSSFIIEQAKYMSEKESIVKKKLIATSIITSAKWMQTLLNGLFMVRKPIVPNIVVPGYEEGAEFVTDNAILFKMETKRKQNMIMVK